MKFLRCYPSSCLQELRKMPQNFLLASLENQFMDVPHDELTRSVIWHYKLTLPGKYPDIFTSKV
jgi:hypothetical protein